MRSGFKPPLLSRRQLQPFVWVAWGGVFTTAVNTIIPLLADAMPAHGPALYSMRDVVLLLHAPATLLPMLGLALLGVRLAPFAAVVAAAAVIPEKLIEFVGQTLRVFPPLAGEENVPVATIVGAIWEQMYFVLWCCNTFGAAAAGVLMRRLAQHWLDWFAPAFAWGAAALTLVLLLGPDYARRQVPAPGKFIFFAVFTGYRSAIAVTLMRAGSRG